MAKGDKGDVINRSESGRASSNQNYQTLYDDLNTKRQDYTNQSNQERQNLLTGYGGLANSPTGGLDPDVIARLRGLGAAQSSGGSSDSGGSGGGGGSSDSGGGGTGGLGAPSGDYYTNSEGYYTNLANGGGVDMGALLMSIPQLQELSASGGFDDKTRASLNDVISQYRGIGTSGGVSDADLTNIRGDIANMRSIAQSGGYDPAALARIRGDIQNTRNLANTGGISDADLASIRGYFGNLQNLVNIGGMSADDIAKFRGTGYDEFARTGGYSDADIANIRSRATSGIPALLAQNTADLNRMRTLQGGYSPGYQSALSRMTRQSGAALSDADLNAELQIKDAVNKGRQWGIAGQESTEKDLQSILTATRLGAASSLANYAPSFYNQQAGNRLNYLKASSEGEANLEADLANRRLSASQSAASSDTNLNDILTKNRLSGLEGAGNLTLGMNKAISDARLNALGQISSTQQGAQGLRQQGMIAGAGGLYNIGQGRTSRDLQAAATRASSGAASAANALGWAQLNAANERYIGQMQQQGMLAGLGGLRDVYGMDPTLARDSLQLNALNSWGQSDRGYLGIEGNMAAAPGTNWAGMLGAAAPFLGGLGGGAGGGGGGGYGGGGGGYGDYYDDWVNSGYQYGGSGDWGTDYGGYGTQIPNPSL